ncbi:MAG: polyphosphate polymerase domain-containing protein [Oscillospiraceae bacterium]|nr:polyphosphate polymerase domain-containing protein [Oscillospiraceae bacterium]
MIISERKEVKNLTGVFKREEIKYLLNEDQYRRMRALIAPYMEEDCYGLTTIYSLYFDTQDDRMIRTSIEKPIYKEKIRLRSYGRPTNGDYPVFLELKKKFMGTVYKRRVPMTLSQANAYILHGKLPYDSQILREIDYSVKYHGAKPALLMCYDRLAMAGTQDETIRMTFDRNIRCRRNRLNPAEGDGGLLLLPANNILLEIKISGAMPLWMTGTLSEIKAYPTSFSKYGAFYEKELCSTETEFGAYTSREAVNC